MAADVFGRADVFAAPEPAREPAREPRRGSTDAPAFDPAAIMASIGEASYEWAIDSDVLTWGPNASNVLMVGSLAAISSGRGYATLLGADAATSRFDAVMKSPLRDEGAGVSYQVQYALHPKGADKALWIEDVGRWFAGTDGKPRLAHGIVRVINERHDQEQRLTYLSQFDALTGEMNRFHLTEVLENTFKQAVAERTSCGFMLVAVDNLARINESYGFDIADEAIGGGGQAPAHQDARRRRARPLLRQQVRHHPQELHAGRHEQGRRAAGRRRPRRRGAHQRRPGRRHRDHRRRHRAAPRRQRRRKSWRAPRRRSTAPRPSGSARSRSIGRMSSARRCGATTCAPPTRSSPR